MFLYIFISIAKTIDNVHTLQLSSDHSTISPSIFTDRDKCSVLLYRPFPAERSGVFRDSRDGEVSGGSDFAVECKPRSVIGGRGYGFAVDILTERRERCLYSHVSRAEITVSHDDFARHVNACMLAVMRFHCENTSALW